MNNTVEKSQVKKSFSASSQYYDQVAGLQRDVARRLMNVIAEDVFQPERILEIGCGTGFFSGLLLGLEGARSLTVLDIAQPMVVEARRQHQSSCSYVCADAEALPFQAGAFDAAYSSLALQWCPNIRHVFGDCYQLLREHGRLCFSTFGPATLQELKSAWRKVDDFSHVNDFLSADELQSEIRQAGFSSIKVKEQMIETVYPDVMNLMQELKGLGAHNVTRSRKRGLTTRRQLRAMMNAYAEQSNPTLRASYQIYYITACK